MFYDSLMLLFTTILPSILFYRTTNIYLMDRKVDSNKSIRILSSIHCISTVTLSYHFLNDTICQYWYSWLLGLSSYGFFVIDLAHLNIFKKSYQNKLLYSYYLHHTLVILCLLNINIFTDKVAIGYLSEVSTLFLNISWYLNNKKQKNNIYIVNSIIILLLFLKYRLYNFYLLLSDNTPITDNYTSLFNNVVITLFLVLNSYWFCGLSKMFKNDYGMIYRKTSLTK